MLERLAGHEYYFFLDGFSGYFQIPIALEDQEKTTFTCPYGTFAYKRMHFGLCNAPTTFQQCMMAIFHELIEDSMEFDIEIRDKKGVENRAADHLSRLENPKLEKLTKAEIRDMFPEEKLMSISDQSNEPCFVYPVDFMILDIKEDEKKPFILGTPFFTTAKAEIKFDKGTISLKFGKSTVKFHKSPDPFPIFEEKDENKVNSLSVINELVLEWEERIRFHHEKELEFEAWKSRKAYLLEGKQILSVGIQDQALETSFGILRRRLDSIWDAVWTLEMPSGSAVKI
ncbi:reverse transcriptase domain-containing protein [Tanacetum coccineum]